MLASRSHTTLPSKQVTHHRHCPNRPETRSTNARATSRDGASDGDAAALYVNPTFGRSPEKRGRGAAPRVSAAGAAGGADRTLASESA